MWVVQRHYWISGAAPLYGLTVGLAGGNDFSSVVAFERPVGQRLSLWGTQHQYWCAIAHAHPQQYGGGGYTDTHI